MSETILSGDCRETLKTIEAGTVHTVVTSPPYWGLRAYIDDPREIGREKTPEEHLANLIEVFREVRRAMRDDGTLWVNYGDAYAASTKGSGGIENSTLNAKRADNGNLADDRKSQPTMLNPTKFNLSKMGYKPKDLLSMPFRVVEALRQDGWYHRSTIVWSKKSPMPESVGGTKWVRCRVKVAPHMPEKRHPLEKQTMQFNTAYEAAKYSDCPGCPKCQENGGYLLRMNAGRPTTSHEYVFLLTKSPSYFYNMDGNRVGYAEASESRYKYSQNDIRSGVVGNDDNRKAGVKQPGAQQRDDLVMNPAGRNLWTVWDDLKSSAYKGAHFATMPLSLAERCVKLGTSDYGCCPTCGAQWAPVVETDRQPTRPATNNKRQYAKDNPINNHSSLGNIDPERHETTTNIKEWRPTCKCRFYQLKPDVPEPVLDKIRSLGLL